MPDVKHMKWWGWGVEGVGFHHENKPGFRPFVINAIDLDVNTPPTAPVSIDDLPIPAPMISDQLLADLTDASVPRTPYKMILTGSCTRTARVPEICCGFGPVIFRECRTSWSIPATRLRCSSSSIAP
jgi:hypothetical protein